MTCLVPRSVHAPLSRSPYHDPITKHVTTISSLASIVENKAFTPTTFLGLGQRFRRSVPSGGFSRGGQTPYRFHSRNHGLCAYISSCLRFAAERSLNWSGRVSGRAKMCSSHSISAIACSASILPQYLPEVCRRRKAALARSLNLCPPAWVTFTLATKATRTRWLLDPN
jgi:hypothetical protein